MLKREFFRGIVIPNICVKLYRNWIINEVARAMTKGEHTNERTYVRTYIRTGQTLYPLHNFVVRGDKKTGSCKLRSKFESLRREIQTDVKKQHDLYVNNLAGDMKK